MAAYQIKHITFTYPQQNQPVLNDVNFLVEEGSFNLLIGQSGSGKTTLLKHLKPQLAPAGDLTGTIHFFGQRLSEIDLRISSSAIGYVMQDAEHQIVTDKVWHELAFGLENIGLNAQAVRLRVAETANFFNLEPYFHRDTMTLSGGQKQLVNLASIMAMQPKVLILDEPTSQLDPITAVEFLETIKKINEELGITIILSEHRLEEVFSFADKVFLMDGGQIIYEGLPQNIAPFFNKTKHPLAVAMPTPIRVASAIGEDKVSPITVKQGRQWLAKKVPMVADNLLQNYEERYTKCEKKAVTSRLATVFSLQKNKPNLAINLNEVCFRYERSSEDVIKNLNLQVAKGECHAILGGNGAGKSTLLKIISGIHTAYRGKTEIFGKSIIAYRKREFFGSQVAMLPQNPQTLFVEKTLLLDLKTIKSDKKIDDILALTELTDQKDRHPYDLSGGEQQRAALAKVLLLDPKIILLDEPTKGLDGFYKIKLATLISKLIKRGTTVVMVSHDIEFCAKYADTCSLLFDAQIVSFGQGKDFFKGNAFYTTAANRMSRHVLKDCVTAEDIINQIKNRN